jgi:hypothetical protein
MTGRWHAEPGRARSWLPAMAALGCVTLAGCGQAVASDTAGTASGTALCANAAHVDRLTIDRDKIALPNVRFSFPAHVTVADTGQVQAVARALCTLPRLPRVIACAADYAPQYRLRFAADSRWMSSVYIDPNGCEQVQGQGLDGRTAGPPNFWRVLGTAAGLLHASRATFDGTRISTKLAVSPPPQP